MNEKYLMDTLCWLNWHIEPEKLSETQYEILEDVDNRIFFSTVSAWEIQVKYRLKKLQLPSLPFRFIPDRVNKDQMEVLPFSLDHSLKIANLPDHHSDPFDRLLIAQAQIGDFTIVTNDPVFELYDVKLVL
jgi:PIN domain nuclease of toxin-antitoxin system